MAGRLVDLLGEKSDNVPDLENNECRHRCSKRFSDTISDFLSSRNFTSSTKFSLRSDVSKTSADSPVGKVPSPHVESAESANSESLSSSFVSSYDDDSDNGTSSDGYTSSNSHEEWEYNPRVKMGVVSEMDDATSPRLSFNESFFSRHPPRYSSSSQLTNADFRRLYYAGRPIGLPLHQHVGPPPSGERFRQFPSLLHMRTSAICIDIPEEDETELVMAASLSSWPIAASRSSGTTAVSTVSGQFPGARPNTVESVDFVQATGSSALRPRKESWLQSLWKTLSGIGSLPYSPRRRN